VIINIRLFRSYFGYNYKIFYPKFIVMNQDTYYLIDTVVARKRLFNLVNYRQKIHNTKITYIKWLNVESKLHK